MNGDKSGSEKMNNSKNYSKSGNASYQNNTSMLNKRPQVYSTYIQPNLSNQHSYSASTNSKPEFSYQKSASNFIKKPKLNQEIGEISSLSSNSIESNHMFESISNQNDPPFLGLNTFQSENVFLDLIQNDMILISLDYLSKSKKNNFCFKGKCSVALVYGHLSINGYELTTDLTKPKWFDLYSPETNSFISILNKLDLKENNNENLSVIQQQDFLINRIRLMTQLDSKNEQLNQRFREFLKDFSTNTTSIFVIRGFKLQMCNYLSYFENFQQIYHSFLTANSKNNDHRDNRLQNDTDTKFARLGLYPVPINNFNAVFIESDEEKTVLNEFANFKTAIPTSNKPNDNSPVVMACGGKDVGKSTFLRYWINFLLNTHQTVAYIDCDPGQCEFTLSGCVTLNLISEPIFGPPHTHLGHTNAVKTCYFLGHLSPSDCPNHYLQCIKQCFEDYNSYKASKNNNQLVPLIINTMGWNQGLGLCLLKETILIVKPTHIIQINHPVEANKNMPVLDKSWLHTADGWSKRKAPSKPETQQQVPDDSNIEIDESTNQELANINYKLITTKSRAPYKSNQFPSRSFQKRFSPRDHRNIATIAYFSNLQDPRQFFKSIHFIKPYRVHWSKFGIHVSHSKIQYDQLFRVLNASLVGLCSIDPKFLIKKDENPELPKTLETYDVEKDIPIVYKCLGFGIIRGINMETKEFYILTPEPMATLDQVNLLVNGMLNLPNEFFFEQDSETSCPYMSYSSNSQNNSNNRNSIGQEPFQRKYLIHQSH